MSTSLFPLLNFETEHFQLLKQATFFVPGTSSSFPPGSELLLEPWPPDSPCSAATTSSRASVAAHAELPTANKLSTQLASDKCQSIPDLKARARGTLKHLRRQFQRVRGWQCRPPCFQLRARTSALDVSANLRKGTPTPIWTVGSSCTRMHAALVPRGMPRCSSQSMMRIGCTLS